jgi:Zn-dependent protease
MLRNLLSGGDPKAFIIQLLLSLPIILLSLSVHETAHAIAANKLGDPTAKNLGRITLNPIKHLDPMGFICMLLCGFGWANPVPINSRYFKKPRRDMAISAAAGPISNVLLAFIFALLLRISYEVLPSMITTENALELANIFVTFLSIGVSLNITLAVFNLLPVPPLDGSRMLYVFLPPKQYFGVMKYERYISLGIMLLLLIGVLDPVISFVSNKIARAIFLVVGL